LKKRTKKLLRVGIRARPSNDASAHDSARAKVFCFFFSKKKFFLYASFSAHATASIEPAQAARGAR
jgi:hypothetical protein